MTFCFYTFGCKVNFAESSTLAREFAAAGHKRVDWVSGGQGDENIIPAADVYVINSCSVTAVADRKCRNLIGRLHRHHPGSRIIVTGCYAQLAPELVAALPGVTAVFGNNFKDEIAELVLTTSPSQSEQNSPPCKGRGVADPSEAMRRAENAGHRPATGMGAAGTADGVVNLHCGHEGIDRFYPAFSVGDRTRSFLKVQDGCDYKCSYCTIPYARGASRSATIEQVVEQARRIAGQKVREIVITGINTGDFGRNTGESFLDLLRALDGVRGIERYRISSIEPNLLTDEIIEFCAASPRFMPHFHIPLQSGSDRILALMRRRYTSEFFAQRVKKVRQKMHNAFIGVDVIVGFPGETAADFGATRGFLEKLRPSQLHVFPYSVRPGTPAAMMPGKLPAPVIAARAAQLGALSEKLYAKFKARFAGTRAKVLWEGGNSEELMSGFTPNYIKMTAPYDPALVNKITKVVL